MVELILGKEGKGKSRALLDYAAEEIKNVNGNIVFLDRNTKNMYELNNKIRLIVVNNYDVKTSDEFIGFILGLLSQDHDLEQILIDGFLDLSHLFQDNFVPTINRLSEISRKFDVKFVISICLDEPDLPEGIDAHIMASL